MSGLADMRNALQATLSAEQQERSLAEQQLEQMTTKVNFFPALAQLSMSANPVQLPAAIYMKNAIERLWRGNSITASDKSNVRELLLRHFAEWAEPRLHKQLVLVLGRLARFDYPTNWPGMPRRLLEQAEQGAIDPARRSRILLGLHYVLKEMSTVRLPRQRREYATLCEYVREPLLALWHPHSVRFRAQLEAATEPQQQMHLSLLNAHYALRALRKLSSSRSTSVKEHAASYAPLVEFVLPELQSYLELRQGLRRTPNVEPVLMQRFERYISKLLSTLSACQQSFADAYEPYAAYTVALICHYVFGPACEQLFDADGQPNMPDFINASIELLTRIYKQPDAAFYIEPAKLPQTFEHLLTLYFRLTPQQLTAWQHDAENFALETPSASDVRANAEQLCVALYARHESAMRELMLHHWRLARNATNMATFTDVLQKEAVYAAVCKLAMELHDDIDFNEWLLSELAPAMDNKTPANAVLRRRTLLLIASYVNVNLSRAQLPVVYAICSHSLHGDPDLVVRLAANDAVKALVTSVDFELEIFADYCVGVLQALYALLVGVKECTTKVLLLDTFTAIVERCYAARYEPAMQPFIACLQNLWLDRDTTLPLRAFVLRALDELLKAREQLPEELTPFLYDCILSSTTANAEDDSYLCLIDDGLNLWCTVIDKTPDLTDGLLLLANNILTIVRNSPELIRKLLQLLRKYILLHPARVLRAFGQSLNDFCDIGRAEGDVAMLMANNYELALRLEPMLGLAAVRPLLSSVLHDLLDAGNFLALRSSLSSLICRTVLINYNDFQAALIGLTDNTALHRLLQFWHDELSSLACIMSRKLRCLALLVVLGQHLTHDLLQVHFAALVSDLSGTLPALMLDAMADELSSSDGSDEQQQHYRDQLHCRNETDVELCIGTPPEYPNFMYAELERIVRNDPVRAEVLTECISEFMYALHQQISPHAFERLLASANQEHLATIEHYITRSAHTFQRNQTATTPP